jgi:hypothetical protein
LWTAFVLIFLDASRSTRCWEILPFTVGVYLLATHQYMMDPILALVGYSEYTFMNFSQIKEPFVRYDQNALALPVEFILTCVTGNSSTNAHSCVLRG